MNDITIKEYDACKKTKEKKKKLLIVDDFDQIREAFRFVLDDYFQIQDFGKSDQALEYFRTFLPDVVFLDISIESSSPTLQGEDLLRLMKKERKETVICMVSACGHLEREMLEQGADGFIHKPCGRGELFDFLIAKKILSSTKE